MVYVVYFLISNGMTVKIVNMFRNWCTSELVPFHGTRLTSQVIIQLADHQTVSQNWTTDNFFWARRQQAFIGTMRILQYACSFVRGSTPFHSMILSLISRWFNGHTLDGAYPQSRQTHTHRSILYRGYIPPFPVYFLIRYSAVSLWQISMCVASCFNFRRPSKYVVKVPRKQFH